jgi:asparagine synthase (glutamine-hydrolysing)
MNACISHRGPDGAGEVSFNLDDGNHLALGHRRLSIIDAEGGQQPLSSHDGRYSLVYNGEIYNYIEIKRELEALGARFQTRSDSEVIIEAWRQWNAKTLSKLRGMFAFCLYDKETGDVILARDPFGKKPLYLSHAGSPHNRTLVFASEVRAVLAHPLVKRELDIESLYDFLCWRYVPGPATMFKNVEKLPPGSYLIWNNGREVARRYYDSPESHSVSSISEADAVQEFLGLFDQGVNIRLRSDVPVGAFLSSGIDSAAVVEAAMRCGLKYLQTFSIGLADDPASEGAGASSTARQLGTRHSHLTFTSDQFLHGLEEFCFRQAAPVINEADIPIYLMSKEAKKSVKVVLTGDGADELLGGYPKHYVEAKYGRLLDSPFRTALSVALNVINRTHILKSHRLATMQRALGAKTREQRMIQWFGGLTLGERDKYWRGPKVSRTLNPYPFASREGASSLKRALHFDQMSWLPDNMLQRLDMLTMAAGLEARSPFLDQDLASFVSTLPDHLRVGRGSTKHILRLAMQSRLPQEVLLKSKIGFRIPIDTSVKMQLTQSYESKILGPDSIISNFVDKELLRKVYERFLASPWQNQKTFWSLHSVEIFLRSYFG